MTRLTKTLLADETVRLVVIAQFRPQFVVAHSLDRVHKRRAENRGLILTVTAVSKMEIYNRFTSKNYSNVASRF